MDFFKKNKKIKYITKICWHAYKENQSEKYTPEYRIF